ncbi:MAG: phosphoribosyltransferase [Bacteroidia bacterium]|nr:phosphoribosyltransferase [Bacteroidia bacterium]
MKNKGTLLLSQKQISQKVERMAMEILERNYREKELIIAGIEKNGFLLAKELAKALKKHKRFRILLRSLRVDKEHPIGKKVETGLTAGELTGKVVLVVDDVLNSGSTLMYGLKPFLSVPLKKLNTAVLVDRSHRRYPVHADHVGLSLSTTLQEHVEVKFGKGGGVFIR